LQGTKSALIPEHSERMARRELNVLTNAELSDHDGAHGGCCTEDGPSGEAEELLGARVR